MSHTHPPKTAALLEDAVEPEGSSCLDALESLASWKPVPGATAPVIAVVGRCGCKPARYERAALVIDGGVVTVAGGLGGEADALRFLGLVAAAIMPRTLESYDSYDDDLVVPCPPPKPSLTEDQLARLRAAVVADGGDLALVFADAGEASESQLARADDRSDGAQQ